MVDKILDYVKNNHPTLKIEDDGGRIYLIRGEKDCIELIKPTLQLIVYKHSSKSMNNVMGEIQSFINLIKG